MFIRLLCLLISFLCSVAFSAKGQHKLWYAAPAIQWEEALPIGNGRLGAMVFGRAEQDEIQFNEETLWTGYPRNYNKADAHLFLDSIRGLIDRGAQQEAEALAMKEFMGLKSETEDNSPWLRKVGEVRDEKDGPFSYAFDDRDWKTLEVPSYEGWETVGLEGVDGAIWFRREFELSAADLQHDWELDLNRVRDVDYTYLNGELIGHEEGETAKRQYEIPKGLLRKGKNVVAVQVINFHGKGGISGYKDTTEHIGLVAPNREKIPLNGYWKYWIQDAQAPKVGSFQASYQPFGSIKLAFEAGEVTDYRRELDLEQSEVRVSYKKDDVSYQRRYFASYPDNLIGIRLTADQSQRLSFKLTLESKHREQHIWRVDGNTLALKVQVKDGALHGVAIVTIRTNGGTLEVGDQEVRVNQADAAEIYLTAATNFEDYENTEADAYAKAQASQAKIQSVSFEQIVQRHQEDHKQLFGRFAIELGEAKDLPTDERLKRFEQEVDPDLVALYVQYGRYLLMASSREGTHPANLQGIWNPLLEPSWGSKYTTNINLEMNYWPTEVLNLRELHHPLFQMIRELSQTGEQTARSYYGARGWVLHHNTDLWRGTAPINNSNHGIWPTGGAWLVHHLWEHYLYNQDVAILHDYYDIIKGATLFFKDFLVRDASTGWLVSTPSNSPEHGGLVKGPTMDHQIIRSLFHIFIETADKLGQDTPLRDSIQGMVGLIAPNQIGKYGQLQEWMEDVDDPNNKHRHVSHLWALHPGNEINWEDTPELVGATKKTLEMRGDDGTGWSLAWKINFWARIRDAQHAMKMIGMLLRPADRSGGSYPNLFDAHPPFQIDGNFGGAAGIAEMLLQSHTSYVEILPALPNELPQGRIRGIRARGNFELEFEWCDHILHKVSVKSHAGNALKLKYRDRTVSLETEKGQVYSFDENLKRLSEKY